MPLAEHTRNVWEYNDIRLSDEQVAQVLWQAGIHDTNAIARLIPIAARESGGRAGVQGTTQPRGAISGDMGLFQINWGAHGQTLLDAGIIQRGEDLYDPVINARAAAYISNNGDPQTSRCLWGIANGHWVGCDGHMPDPVYGPVQAAQASGLLGQNYTGGPGTTTGNFDPLNPSGPQGNTNAIPPSNMATSYYDSLYAGYDAQLGLNAAITENEVGYARGQQGYANELAGYQQQALGYDRERYNLENTFQNDLALLNRNLTQSQITDNAARYREVATNLADLQDLADRGLRGDKQYLVKSNRLDRDIFALTRGWVGKQKGFNARDYDLARAALRNVLKTETARWSEVKRVSGAEKNLARQKQSFIRQGATETYGQAIKEAAFVEKEQVRKAASEAISKGARTSRGFGEDVAAFGEQEALAGSAATVTRDDVLRMSRNQLAGELEQINQAYNQGQISYSDARRQNQNAQRRARLTWQQNQGQLNYQAGQNRLQLRGSQLDNVNQYRNQRLAYLTDTTNRTHTGTMNTLDYNARLAQLNAEAQNQARTQAYNNALYGVNLADLNNTGRVYGTQLAQQQAATRYGIDQSYLQGVLGAGGIYGQQSQTQQDQTNNIYGNMGSGGGGYRGPTPPSYTPDPNRNVIPGSGVYVPPASAYD